MKPRGILLFIIALLTATPVISSASDIAQKTMGWCSPAVADVKGKVTIVCNGVDPKAIKRLNELLDKKDIELSDKIREADAWTRKYNELQQRLTAEGKEDPLALEAKSLIQKGKLEEAGKILDQLLVSEESQVDKIAANHFNRGQIFELQFKPLEAFPHYRKAYDYRPENFEYAHTYARLLQDQKRHDLAERVYLNNLKKIRALEANNPNKYLSDVARTLNNLGLIYYDTQRFSEAEKAYKETLVLRRKLAIDNQANNLSNLVIILNDIGLLYEKTQRFGEAEKVCLEALSIYRKLAVENPPAYLYGLALILHNLGGIYKDTQHYREAEKNFQEALDIFQVLAMKNPDTYLSYVAGTLNTLGIIYLVSIRKV